MLTEKAAVLSYFTRTQENLGLSRGHKIKFLWLHSSHCSVPCVLLSSLPDEPGTQMSRSLLCVHVKFKYGKLSSLTPPPSSKSLVSKRLGDLLTSAGRLLSVLKEIWAGAVAAVLELIDNDIPASVTHYPYYKLLRPNWKINSLLAPVPVAASFDCQLLSRVSTYMKGAVTAWCFQDNLTIWN